MSTNSSRASPEALLEHAGFLTALARTLVRGGEEPEEYVQATFAGAIARPPRAGPGLRGWLAVALRNALRQDRRARARRDAREAVVARPESLVADAADRERARREVVDAVFRLDPPCREVVVLRYLDELPPRTIAARLGVPVETVRTRLKRALDRLRADLDARRGGDRRAWVAALLPLARRGGPGGPPAAAGLAVGAAVMSAKKLVAAAVVLVLLAFGAWFLTRDGAPPPAPVEPEKRVAANGESPPAADPPLSVEAGAPAGGPAVGVAVRFVDEAAAALAPAEVRRRYDLAGLGFDARYVPESALAESSGAGLLTRLFGDPAEYQIPAALEFGAAGPALTSKPPVGRWRLFLSRPGAAPFLTEPLVDPAEVTIPLPSRVETYRLQLVDADTGGPAAGAVLTPYYEFGDDSAFFRGAPIRADDEGVAMVPLLKAERQREPTWWAEWEGRVAEVSAPWSGSEQTVTMPRTATVLGRAFLSDGRPAEGRTVLWRKKGYSRTTIVGGEGRFRLEGVPALGGTIHVVLLEDLASASVRMSEAEAGPGGTAEIQIGEPAGGGAVDVVGRIRCGGRPIAGLFVGLSGKQKADPDRIAVTDAEGVFRFGNAGDGDRWLLLALGNVEFVDDFMLWGAAPIRATPGGDPRIEIELPNGWVRATLLDDETGRPIPGAGAMARAPDPDAPEGALEGFTGRLGWGDLAGEDGTVLLPSLPGPQVVVFGLAPGYEEAKSDPIAPGPADKPAEITLRLRARK